MNEDGKQCSFFVKEWKMVNFKLGEINVKMKWSASHGPGTKKKERKVYGLALHEFSTAQHTKNLKIQARYKESLNARAFNISIVILHLPPSSVRAVTFELL